MDWGLALSTTATGLVVVFLVLIILIVVVSILGKIMSSITNRKSRKEVAGKKEQEMQPAGAMESNTSVQIELEDGISDEVVAAISAAVTMIMSAEGKGYRIRSVKRNKDNRPAWSAAGIRDNTRPF